MEGKSNFFILLFIVAILTLTLAVLAGYLFFVGGASHNSLDVAHNESTTRPSDDQLSSKSVYSSKQYFNLKSTDSSKLSVIQVDVQLVYFNKIKGIKSVDAKLTSYDGEIKELIGTYFQNMTVEEAKMPETKEKAKNDLKKKINDLLNSSEKNKQDIIYTINFDEWFYQ